MSKYTKNKIKYIYIYREREIFLESWEIDCPWKVIKTTRFLLGDTRNLTRTYKPPIIDIDFSQGFRKAERFLPQSMIFRYFSRFAFSEDGFDEKCILNKKRPLRACTEQMMTFWEKKPAGMYKANPCFRSEEEGPAGMYRANPRCLEEQKTIPMPTAHVMRHKFI